MFFRPPPSKLTDKLLYEILKSLIFAISEEGEDDEGKKQRLISHFILLQERATPAALYYEHKLIFIEKESLKLNTCLFSKTGDWRALLKSAAAKNHLEAQRKQASIILNESHDPEELSNALETLYSLKNKIATDEIKDPDIKTRLDHLFQRKSLPEQKPSDLASFCKQRFANQLPPRLRAITR